MKAVREGWRRVKQSTLERDRVLRVLPSAEAVAQGRLRAATVLRERRSLAGGSGRRAARCPAEPSVERASRFLSFHYFEPSLKSSQTSGRALWHVRQTVREWWVRF